MWSKLNADISAPSLGQTVPARTPPLSIVESTERLQTLIVAVNDFNALPWRPIDVMEIFHQVAAEAPFLRRVRLDAVELDSANLASLAVVLLNSVILTYV